jgi:FAD/FMN-containing dehydrogenase
VSSVARIAWHALLLDAFRRVPTRSTARALVRHTHRNPDAAVAALRRWTSTPEYARRARATAVALPPSFTLNNLRMPDPPSSFVQLYGSAASGARDGSAAALESMLRAVLSDGQCGKAVGGGWGFSNVAVTQGCLAKLSGLHAILPIDDDTVNGRGMKLLQFEAGATIDQLNAAMPKGYGLVNQPGFGQLTFAGTASAGGHGSSLKWGALADAIRSMRVLSVDHNREPKWFQIEPSDGITLRKPLEAKHPDVELIQDDAKFRACIVAMGCMGIIYSMIIELRPVKTLTETRAMMTWSDATRTFQDLVDENRDPESDLHSFVYWLNPYPTLGDEQHVVVATYYERGDPLGGERPIEMTGIGGNRALEEAVVALVNWWPALAPWLIEAAISEATDSNVVMNPPEALNFGAPNNLDVIATACAVPVEETLATVDRLSKLLQDRPYKLTSTFGLRFVPKARGLLAPQSAGDTCMIEVPCLAGTDGAEATVAACWQDMVDHGARPHWGQRNPLSADELRKVYGDDAVDAFKAVRDVLDPTRFFDNDFTRQVGL